MKSWQKNVSIPIDLIIEIFLRLPAKSIARFRCVSKLWASLLLRQDFTELFLTKSSAQPQLLFVCRGNNELFFFSAHQPQNPDENSSVVIANHLAHFPCDSKVFAPVNGFFCLCLEDEQILNGRKYRELVLVICNPSTGQSFTLPKGKTRRKVGVGSYIGYDPTKKQFKVLSMTWLTRSWSNSEEHQVMTLGTDTPFWKIVECCISHYPGYGSGICINGVVYYKAKVNTYSEVSMIVCFDFRSDKFNVLKVKETFNRAMPHTSTLINYNGKLGLLMQDGSYYLSYVNGTSRSFELWVLEDDEKQEWSKHINVLPTLWKNVVGETELYFVGIIGTSEIVLAPRYQSMPYYIFYYNTERKTITRVVIQGSKAFKDCSVRTFLNYVDNVMLIQEL